MSEEDKQIKKHWSKKLSYIFSKPPQNKRDLSNYLLEKKLVNTHEKSVIDGAFQLSNMQVADVIIPRSQIVSVKIGEQPEDFLPKMLSSAHSRFPVFGENSDEVLGILIAKDLLKILLDKNSLENFDMKNYLHPVLIATEYTKLYAMLAKFRESKQHMAIVVNEYGGLDGLITLEDILEELVGEIDDEHDTEETDYITPNKDGYYVISTLIPIEEFNEYFGFDFPTDTFDTLGGIIVHEFDHLPHKGESIIINDVKFIVSVADNRRLYEVKAIITKPTS